MILAIFHSERVYEGNMHFLNAIYPMPAISKVLIDMPGQPELLSFGNVNQFAPPVFREGSFDPTTRIRRGRFYVPEPPTPRDWQPARVNHYPYAQPVGGIPLTYSFDCYSSFQPLPVRLTTRPLVLLGDASYRTAWHVVGAERLFNGETLFTLKAADTLGLLPDLNAAAVPREKLTDVQNALEKVADAAPKYLPVPIVDVCRECARVLIAAWLPTAGVDNERGDLGDLISKIPHAREPIAAAARIINRFHPRGKSAEQEKQADRGIDLRDVSPEDAELSVTLIGLLLREVGWAV